MEFFFPIQLSCKVTKSYKNVLSLRSAKTATFTMFSSLSAFFFPFLLCTVLLCTVHLLQWLIHHHPRPPSPSVSCNEIINNALSLYTYNKKLRQGQASHPVKRNDSHCQWPSCSLLCPVYLLPNPPFRPTINVTHSTNKVALCWWDFYFLFAADVMGKVKWGFLNHSCSNLKARPLVI